MVDESTATGTPAAAGSTPPPPTPAPDTKVEGNTPPAPKVEDKKVDTAPAPEAKKYKVKVDGKDVEVDESELLRGYTHAQAANKKFQEAAMSRKQAEEFVHLLRTDPLKVLSDPRLGHDVRKLAEQYLISEMEKEMMTPEQKELAEAKKKLQDLEEEKKASAKAEEERQQAALTQQYAESYSNDIIKVLDSAGLPKTEHTVRRMAYYMYQALTRGFDLKAADVVDLVKQDYINETKALYGNLDGEMLIKLLGDDVASKIRKFDLDRVKNNPASKVTTPANQPPVDPEKKPKSKKLSKEEWRDKLAKIKEGSE